jgi:hypothetical protein
MPEIYSGELHVTDITDTAKTVKNANPEKSRDLTQLRTITITGDDTEIMVKNTPEALSGFALGSIAVTFSIPQTTMADFDKNQDETERRDDLIQSEADALKDEQGTTLEELDE